MKHFPFTISRFVAVFATVFLCVFPVMGQQEPEPAVMVLKSAAVALPAPLARPMTQAPAVPEGFVVYTGLQDQFTIAIPEDWAAYDQSRLLKGTPARFGMVLFLPAKDFTNAGSGLKVVSAENMIKINVGDVPSFFVQRRPADGGMSCSGISKKSQKKLVNLIGKDPSFKGKKGLEPAHAEAAMVAGCKGLRIQAKGPSSPGGVWVADAYVASDGDTVYIFGLRNREVNFDKNADIFQKAVATAKLTATK